jgi:HD-GYP domain-containing protein (c-di-GMP phosphodiesterase class II)
VQDAPLAVAMRQRRAVLATPDRGPGTRLIAPVLVDDALWGAIRVESELGDAFDQADIALVEAMAVQMGRSIAVTRLLERLAAGGWDEARGSAVAPADPHGRAVAALASQVGHELGMRGQELRALHVAALFHELGTVCAPAGLMQKRGHLTPEEFDVVRGHPLVGERLLGSLSGLAPAARVVRSERERFDGLGYPDGLEGEDIPVESRILAVVDAFVAMTEQRPYRGPRDHNAAAAELRAQRGTQFDPRVLDAFEAELQRDLLFNVLSA